MLLYLFYVNFQSYHKKRQHRFIQEFIGNVIIQEDDDIIIPEKVHRMLRYNYFRQFITEELVNAKKNLTGISGESIKRLYEKLGLNSFSIDKIKSFKWHYKAQGIRELAIMEHDTALSHIIHLANDKNELVRREAQVAIVKLQGFNGLHFLDEITHSIPEWQQISLLDQIQIVMPENFSAIDKWLQSTNESVVVFALKLAGIYQCFVLYDSVVQCFSHNSMDVWIEAAKCLESIADESASALLIERYHKGSKQYQLTVLHALRSIAGKDDIPFLLCQFAAADHEIKLAAAYALVKNNELAIMEAQPFSGDYPWTDIIKQVKSEVIAWAG